MAFVNVQFILMLCSSSLLINGQISSFNTNTKNDYLLTLAETALNLVRRYFSKNTSTISLIEKSVHSDLSDSNKDILDYITQNLNGTIAIQLYFGKSDNKPWEYNVFIVDSEQAFLNILKNFPNNNFDVEFRFLIILTNHTSDYLQTIEKIFKACKFLRVINANILLNHKILGVCLYDYNIFSETKCDVVQPYLFYRISDGLDKLSDMFPGKLLNFHGCPLRICGVKFFPMLGFVGNESDPKSERNWSNLLGTDGHLIRVLSQSLNFTIDFLPFLKEETYFDNKTAYGCYRKLLNDQTDIAVGGLSASDPQRFGLTLSISYYESPIIFIVRGKRELDDSNRLGRPFSIVVWHSTVGLLIAGSLLIQALWFLKPSVRQYLFGERNNTPLSNFYAIFLGYSITKVPTQNFARYLFILWLLMTLILRNAYQGSLYDSIRIDRYEKIPTKYEELFERNYTFFISKYYADIDLFPHSNRVYNCDYYLKRLKTLEKLDGNYATIALRDHVLIYLENNIRRGCDLKIIDDPVYLFRSAIYFQKHSIYLTTFNDKLRTLYYFGILKYIARSNSIDSRLFKDDTAAPLKPMTINRIWSLYLMCMVLLGGTCAVFALELMSLSIEKLRIILNWMH